MKRTEIVDAWLTIATRDLCPAAKERIALEITAHYDEAVAAHVTEGLPLMEAKLQAREELGDAEAAEKRFRKRHLTVKEFAFAEKQRKGWLVGSSMRIIVLFAVASSLLVWLAAQDYVCYFILCVLLWETLIALFSIRTARFATESIAVKKLGKIAIAHLTITIALSFLVLNILGTAGMWVTSFGLLAMRNDFGWLLIIYKSMAGSGTPRDWPIDRDRTRQA